jgi:hypothetical protein
MRHSLTPNGGIGDIDRLVSFGEDLEGNLYLADIIDGEIFRINTTNPGSGQLVPEPSSVLLIAGFVGLILLVTILRWHFDRAAIRPRIRT